MPPDNEGDGCAARPNDFTTQIKGFFALFEAAFDELHQATVKVANTPGQYLSPHHDYPTMSTQNGAFPTFHEVGFYKDDAPRDYVSAVRPRGLYAVLANRDPPKISLARTDDLADFLRSQAIGKRLQSRLVGLTGEPTNWAAESLVNQAVERYLQLYGLSAPIDPARRSKVLAPLVAGTTFSRLNLRLLVPIAMTHFDVDHFRLSETTFITRIPRRLQLARARMSTLGTGAVKMVVGAATHAFVSNLWHLEVETVDEVAGSLNQTSANVLDAIDSFFGALRLATGIRAGYAQMVWVPRRWALEYFCDLPPIYGATLRSYPESYDNYAWAYAGDTVTSSQLAEVRRIYHAVTTSSSERVRLAIRRLNQCLVRTDAADAILDATIGLELLLGDDENQSLSYKLRLRAGALAGLHHGSSLTQAEVAANVKRVYEARSAIVHGGRRRRSRAAAGPADTSHAEDRKMASDLLRFVLEVLLTYPEYLEPVRIDELLLLRGGEQPRSSGGGGGAASQ